MNFKVNIDFQRGPSASIEVSAQDKESAIAQAKRQAIEMGFDDAVKKVTVVSP